MRTLTAEGRGYTFRSGTVQGEEKPRSTQTNTFFSFSANTVRMAKAGSYHNGRPRNSAKEHAHGADDISAEKESDETVTMSRADTISRTEGGGK